MNLTQHEIFSFQTLDQLKESVKELKLKIEFDNDIDVLLEPVTLNGIKLRNRLTVHPMEGADGTPTGSPSELTYRRYKRFAAGGAGLIWMEACAVTPEGRANPRQIWITENNLSDFQRLVEETHKAAETFDKKHKTVLILQLTHSGRYSKPYGKPAPIIAHHSKILDPLMKLGDDYPLISDDELKALEDKYAKAAILAEKAGFDGVDIKSCHRYLLSELLASYTRENSIYGGSFENRTRLLRNAVTKVKDAVKSIFVTARINAYDSMEYPYGFGVDKNDVNTPDLSEIKEIAKFFVSVNSPFLNITIGNPYYNPYVNRPFDLPTIGASTPAENQLVAVERFITVVDEIQNAIPQISIIGGGYTWLRNYFPYVAASNIKNKRVSLVGLGRMSFAYPDFIKDLTEKKELDGTKVCVACSACTQIMRDGGTTGCVPRDGEIYGEIYKKGRMTSEQEIMAMAEKCKNCVDPTCRNLCPAHVNIPGFVRKIADGDFQGAYEILLQNNPFPEICGNVCPSEELCEKGCINRYYNESVHIRHLQRFVSEKARIYDYKVTSPKVDKKINKKVAVIGAGPSGLACAKMLISAGVKVTIFDKNNYPGGVPFDLIPEARIKDQDLTGEIDFRLKDSELMDFKGNKQLSKDFNIDNIFSEGYDAIYIATGLTESLHLDKQYPAGSGVEDAFSFLKRMKKGTNREIPNDVAVIGGGNTAIDAALTAKKFGARDVYVIYRRSFNEMPAWQKERELAMNSGVNFLILTQPIEYIFNNENKLTGIKVVRTKLSDTFDNSGRRKPIDIKGTEHIIDMNLAIEAIGQKISGEALEGLTGIEFTKKGLVKINPDTLQTSRKCVFAGGDIINGGDTVVKAIADGTKAAAEILKSLI
jgi:2,4-dienoyl-CoA reductase (NADPH2)